MLIDLEGETQTMTLKAFGDESTDETRSRVFAVAGVVGREHEWQAAEKEWLHRTGIGPKRRPPRKSMIALKDHVNLRVLDRKHFEGVRILAERLEGEHLPNYAAWLGKSGRDDNLANRIDYIAFVESRDEGGGL